MALSPGYRPPPLPIHIEFVTYLGQALIALVCRCVMKTARVSVRGMYVSVSMYVGMYVGHIHRLRTYT